jgi:hypothetical protein
MPGSCVPLHAGIVIKCCVCGCCLVWCRRWRLESAGLRGPCARVALARGRLHAWYHVPPSSHRGRWWCHQGLLGCVLCPRRAWAAEHPEHAAVDGCDAPMHAYAMNDYLERSHRMHLHACMHACMPGPCVPLYAGIVIKCCVCGCCLAWCRRWRLESAGLRGPSARVVRHTLESDASHYQ